MEQPVKIIIAEDHLEYRAELVNDLKEANIETIGEAGNGIELLSLMEKGYRPDAILLDLNMPEMDGRETFKVLMNYYPWAKVIIVSSYGEVVLMEDYMERGAKGYISKQEISKSIQLLVDAIKRVHRGGNYPIHAVQPDSLRFTKKQKELITHITEDKSKTQIAKDLGIGRSAVDKAIDRLIKKMKLKTKEGLFVKIFSMGLNFLGRNDRTEKRIKKNIKITKI